MRFADNPYQLSRFVREFRNLAAKKKKKKKLSRALQFALQMIFNRTGREWTIVSQFSYGNNGGKRPKMNGRWVESCLAVFQTLSITEHRSRPVKLDEEDRGGATRCVSPLPHSRC